MHLLYKISEKNDYGIIIYLILIIFCISQMKMLGEKYI